MPAIRKSNAEKRAAGTLQQCRRSPDIPVSGASLTDVPPVGLTKDARTAWKTAIACAPKGVLTALDFTVLERWARNYALYRKASKEIEHQGLTVTVTKPDGTEYQVENPLCKTLFKLQAAIVLCEKELGFTPASRARVKIDADEEKVNDFDGF